jgi:hypothetical protein
VYWQWGSKEGHPGISPTARRGIEDKGLMFQTYPLKWNHPCSSHSALDPLVPFERIEWTKEMQEWHDALVADISVKFRSDIG